jgi:hypothetical protein
MDKDDDDDSGYNGLQSSGVFLAKRRREYEMVGEL